jgi:hypothetical protein
MSTVVVTVHLNVDVWDHTETEAYRITRGDRAEVFLQYGRRATGQWDGADTKAVAGSIARQFGLDSYERPRATVTDTYYADDSRDPRWIVVFDMSDAVA